MANEFLTIIILSRSRVENLAKTIDNLNNHSYDYRHYKIIVGIDYDDPHKKEYYTIKKNFSNISFHVLNNSYMSKMTNELIKKTKSKYILLYNDDCKIFTKNWDIILKEKLSENPNRLFFMGREYVNDIKNYNFPILKKKYFTKYSILPDNYFSEYIDTHIYDIFLKLNLKPIHIPQIFFYHLKDYSIKSSLQLKGKVDFITYFFHAINRHEVAKSIKQQLAKKKYYCDYQKLKSLFYLFNFNKLFLLNLAFNKELCFRVLKHLIR